MGGEKDHDDEFCPGCSKLGFACECEDVEIGDSEIAAVTTGQFCPECDRLRTACVCSTRAENKALILYVVTCSVKEYEQATAHGAQGVRIAFEDGSGLFAIIEKMEDWPDHALVEEKAQSLEDRLVQKTQESDRWQEAYEKVRGELGELGQLKQEAEELELDIKRLKRERDQAQRWWDRMLGIAKLSWKESDELKKLVAELQSTKSKEPTEGLYWALSEVRTWAGNAESTRLACSKVIEIADAAMAKARELGFKPEGSRYED